MARAPLTVRLSPVYEYGLTQIAEREGVPLGTLLRRILEEWAQADSRTQAARVSDALRSTTEGQSLEAFADAAVDDMLTLEQRPAAARKHGNE